MQVIPAEPGSVLISVEYPSDGVTWARLYDNPLLGWIVDETGANPPKPVVIGNLPTAAGVTAPILSPQWATFTDPVVMVPDQLRDNLPDFLTWLATNNGADRVLDARFAVSRPLFNGYAEWAALNPELTFKGDPPEPPPPEGGAQRRGRA